MTTEILEACYDGDVVYVRRVLDDVVASSVGPDGHNVVHLAAERGDVAFLDAVLECVEQRCGAETKRTLLARVTDEHGCTPLHLAAAEPDVLLTSRLVRHGADAEALDRLGRTPFLVAAFKGHEHVVRFFVRRAEETSPEALVALVRSRCVRDGCTALHRACYVRNAPVARLLLAHRADPSCRNASGATPFAMAIASNDDALIDAFLDHLSDMSEPDRVAALNAATADGVLPLHVARIVGNRALVARLSAAGARDHPPPEPFGAEP